MEFLTRVEQLGFTTGFDDSAFSCRCSVCGEWLHFSPAGLNFKGGAEAAITDLEQHKATHADRPAKGESMPEIEVENFDGIISVTMPMPLAEQLKGILDKFIARQSVTLANSPQAIESNAAGDIYNALSRAGVL